MFLMYVDESGDIGMTDSPSRYFVLSGLVVHELRWSQYHQQLVEFRRRMKQKYGLLMREEIHAARMITQPGALVRMKVYDRIAIIREFADELATMSDLRIINVVVDKEKVREKFGTDYDVFNVAWTALIQRFENTISNKKFPGPQNPIDKGVIYPDHTDDRKLTQLLRRMRYFNYVPSKFTPSARNLKLKYIMEDPSFRDSAQSYYLQCADLAAFLLYQRFAPNKQMKKRAGHNYFLRLESILCKEAASNSPLGYGIVSLPK